MSKNESVTCGSYTLIKTSTVNIQGSSLFYLVVVLAKLTAVHQWCFSVAQPLSGLHGHQMHRSASLSMPATKLPSLRTTVLIQHHAGPSLNRTNLPTHSPFHPLQAAISKSQPQSFKTLKSLITALVAEHCYQSWPLNSFWIFSPPPASPVCSSLPCICLISVPSSVTTSVSHLPLISANFGLLPQRFLQSYASPLCSLHPVFPPFPARLCSVSCHPSVPLSPQIFPQSDSNPSPSRQISSICSCVFPQLNPNLGQVPKFSPPFCSNRYLSPFPAPISSNPYPFPFPAPISSNPYLFPLPAPISSNPDLSPFPAPSPATLTSLHSQSPSPATITSLPSQPPSPATLTSLHSQPPSLETYTLKSECLLMLFPRPPVAMISPTADCWLSMGTVRVNGWILWYIWVRWRAQ